MEKQTSEFQVKPENLANALLGRLQEAIYQNALLETRIYELQQEVQKLQREVQADDQSQSKE